ncbi:MAG: FAD:protein FMN transferase [Rhodobacterales bacterium]|nr:FAD:protein FMN transferase [Rhodobacterales bacterium]
MPKTPTDIRLALGGPTMGTRWSVLIEDPLADATLQSRFQAAVDEVDAQMSTWKPDSDLMRLNAAPLDRWVPLPDRLLVVLEAGLAISRQTHGAFEMNIGDAVRAWGFGPDAIALDAIRTASSARRIPATDALEIDLVNGMARKSSPLALDLSGIAKGYGVDRLAETAQALGLAHALCTIDGEVRAVGSRLDGRPWAIGIETPDDSSTGRHSILEIEDKAMATSGDYRHFVTVGTARLSHTMDPHRGAHLVAAPASVTVLSQSCMMADAMATALMVMGDGSGPCFAGDHAISALFLLRLTGKLIAVGTGAFAKAQGCHRP